MTIYSLALFAHLLGVLGLFIGMGLQWTAALRLRRARTVAQVREWGGVAQGVERLGPVSGALILGAGVYMALSAWNLMTPWIVVSLAAMALMLALGMGVTTRRLRAIQRTASVVQAPADGIPAGLWRQIHDPVVWIATLLAASTAVGVVFLMTTKPGLGGSLLVMGVALVLGGLIGGLSAKPGQGSQGAETGTTAIPTEEASLS
jgi:predicted integral membrane protein DUF2269